VCTVLCTGHAAGSSKQQQNAGAAADADSKNLRIPAGDAPPAVELAAGGHEFDQDSAMELAHAQLVREYERARRDADPALLHLDAGILTDIVVLSVCAALGGLLAASLKLPPAIGFVLGGVLVGPSGAAVLTHVVEVSAAHTQFAAAAAATATAQCYCGVGAAKIRSCAVSAAQ
jgi:hypothetical protein